MKLSFHGADREVTGSCHMVECAGRRILVDCGLHQGGRELEEDNADPFEFEARGVDAMLLTHAHLDHCGRIPLLVKRGFRGEIIATAATRELARVVLLDSANLLEEEARHRARRAARSGRPSAEPPLYSVLDALNSLERFERPAGYGRPIDVVPGVRATFLDAGHILGSASVLLELEESGRRRSVVFSGDLGNAGRPLLGDPIAPQRADAVVMETTYGDRAHRALEPSVDELYTAIGDTFARGGNVIIPTFALERAQELLFYLREGVEKGRLPRSAQVFLDSPMAISATEIFARHPDCFRPELAELLRDGRDPFALPGLRFTRETAESVAINRIRGGAVIMAGSGMCTGGRVRHHLKYHLWREDSSIVFVGFAARGTLARAIIDGAKQVRLWNEEIPVRAKIHTIGGFSAHADQPELLAWRERIGGGGRTFLVHGEEDTMAGFAKLVKGPEPERPSRGEVFDL